jgi:hypothetical protein
VEWRRVPRSPTGSGYDRISEPPYEYKDEQDIDCTWVPELGRDHFDETLMPVTFVLGLRVNRSDHADMLIQRVCGGWA